MPSLRIGFQRVVLSRPMTTFVVMGLAFFLFGASSVNLFNLFHANFELIVTHGWMAALDGGLRQLFELLCSGYFSVASYVVFKTCESSLVEHLRR